jgi:4-amino-4-deoxy-L-arabinose transferase-like glycosyltransferase
MKRWTMAAALAVILLQVVAGVHQVANVWQHGHIGYNSAAYHQAARNTLRWGELFPAQYVTGSREPGPRDLYTHAPLALHLHTVASVATVGDNRVAVRLVPLLHGVAAAVALLLVVAALYGWTASLLATAIYVSLPINAIYAHMSNHSTGFLLWSLLWLACYLRWIGALPLPKDAEHPRLHPHPMWAVGIFATGFMAMQWDWPAYYVAFAIAVHWAVTLVRRHRSPSRASQGIRRQWLLLAGFCLFVLASFGGQFWLAASHQGGLDEIAKTFRGRSASVSQPYEKLFTRALQPFYGVPLLVLCVAWLGAWLFRLVRGRAQPRDLVPVSFAFAGITHTLLFKKTVLIHPYWPWPLNPFVAIAGATGLLFLVHVVRRGARWIPGSKRVSTPAITALASMVVLGAFAAHHVPFSLHAFVEGRREYGSPGYKGYDPGYLGLRFAEQLQTWTRPDTRVVVHRAIRCRIHFKSTADRMTVCSRHRRPKQPRSSREGGGAVFVGPVHGTKREHLVQAAASHPYRQYGLHYMVDYRQSGPDVRIWDLVAQPAPFTWRFFVNPWHGPHEVVRNHRAEARLLSEIRRVKGGGS